MPTLATTLNGLLLPNPFIIASGPPGTNFNVIAKAFREGWGAVVAKTVSLDASKVVNVSPRYAKLHSTDRREVLGWENIELISDRRLEVWLEEFRRCKDMFPEGVIIASIMEENREASWVELVERCQEAGVDGFELNFSCPHGLPERQMGSAMGENPETVEEVCGWVKKVARKPFWAKMTPNVTRIEEPSRAALRGGAAGITAINTIRCVMGVNLDTLRPEPTVEGCSTAGGYSSRAIKPIALRMVMEIAQMLGEEFPGRSLLGLGGIETAEDAAQFILLGADAVQVCTGVMKYGYELVKPMSEGLLAFMEKHGFESPASFKGRSLAYIKTHAELVAMQAARQAVPRSGGATDAGWRGEDFVRQSEALVSAS